VIHIDINTKLTVEMKKNLSDDFLNFANEFEKKNNQIKSKNKTVAAKIHTSSRGAAITAT